MSDAARAAFEAYGVVMPVPAGPLPATPEQDAGLVSDPQRAQDIADAAREQARAECAAELAQAQQDREARTWFHDRWKAVNQLLAGRPDDDLMLVREILAAADPARPAGAPLTVTWNRTARVPDAHDAHKKVVVECTSVYGGRADLVVEGDDRMALAGLLDAEVIRDINAPCPHEAGCGSDDAHLESAGVFGWFRMEVGGLDGGLRWYCSPGCVNAAIQRASVDLALADEAARYPEAVVGPYPQAPADMAEDLDARYGPGASDEYALQVAEATEAGFEDERGDDGDGAL